MGERVRKEWQFWAIVESVDHLQTLHETSHGCSMQCFMQKIEPIQQKWDMPIIDRHIPI
jgi:hypothetical protein